MTNTFRALCAELHQCLEYIDRTCDVPIPGTLLDRARTALAQPEPARQPTFAELLMPPPRSALAQPEPVAPTDETKEAMISALNTLEGWDNFDHWVWPVSALEQSKKNTTESLQMLRAVLARYGTPTIQPVPVSERPWEREGWCDAEGRCYGWDGDYWWMVGNPGAANETITHCLPHWALPVPEQSLDSPYIFGTSVKEQMPPLSHP